MYQSRGPAYFKHLSRHLREVSLYVLPQSVDENDGFDSSDGDPPSSTPDEEGPESDDDLKFPQRPPGEDEEEDTDRSASPGSPEDIRPPTATPSGTAEGGSSDEIDLDSIIDRLLEVRGSRPGKQVQLLEAEIRYLCAKSRDVFISQPILLELEAPLAVCTPPYPN